MANLYEIIAAMPSQELTSTGQLRDVMTLTGVTIPHSVNFTVTVPKTAGWREAALAAAAQEAAELEAVFGTYGA